MLKRFQRLMLLPTVLLLCLMFPYLLHATVTVSIPTGLSAGVGDTDVHVPILTTNIDAGLGIVGIDLEVAYDPTVLTATGASLSGCISEGGGVEPNLTTPGLAVLGVSHTSVISGSGTLAYVIFDVVSTDTSDTTDLQLMKAELNEEPAQVVHGDIALPVSLGAFWGETTDEGITLRWQTESEFANLGFTVYRSGPTDEHFVPMGFVRSRGDGSQTTNYAFLDDTAVQGESYRYLIEDISLSGIRTRHVWVEVLAQPHTRSANAPLTWALLQNYPNPFNPDTWIPYALAEQAHVTIHIHDLIGHRVRTLDLGDRPAGAYLGRGQAAYWDGKTDGGEVVPSGVYLCTLIAGDFTSTRKMVTLK